MNMISPHISYIEATRSETAIRRGILNDPPADKLEAMKLVAEKVFEPVRNHFGVPIRINSFYRSPVLNIFVGGAKGSQHMRGEAIDMDAIPSTGLTNREIFEWIKSNLEFDQLINEYDFSWVHCSYSKTNNRKQVFEI